MKIKGILFILAACIAHTSAMEPKIDASAQEQMERLFTEKLPPELQDMIINKVLESPFPKTNMQDIQNFLMNYLNMIVSLDSDFFPQETKKQYLNKFAKQWYLNYGKYLKIPAAWIQRHFPGKTPEEVLDYGFSIAELLKAKRLPAISPQKILNLKNLDINNLDGLQEIPNIETVERLDLNDNALTAVPPKAFAGLKSLRWLDLRNNQISTLASDAFAELDELQVLFLKDNRITDLGDAVAGLQNLEWLALGDNQISSITAENLAGLKKLRTLGLKNNQIIIIAPNAFAGLNDLINILLNKNQIRAIAPSDFANLNLKLLALRNNPLTDESKQALQKQLGNRVRF